MHRVNTRHGFRYHELNGVVGARVGAWKTTHRDGSVSVNLTTEHGNIRLPLGEFLRLLGITAQECVDASEEAPHA